MDFAVEANFREKTKENKKGGKYLNLVKELKKKLWNMKVTVILIVIGALKTILKGLRDWKT